MDVITGAGDAGISDGELLAAVGDGDRYAFADLYARHSPWLLLRLSRRCGDHGLVDEVLQDTFLAVWRGARSWTGQGEVAAWLWGIASRRLIDGYRRRVVGGLPMPEGESLGAAQSAEDELLAAGEYGDVSTALSTLPTDLREALRATVVDGLTTAEAAQRLGIPAGTVKTRVMRAKAVLRKALS
jgi:RNA polymerase sigma-70 factor (ECF subfamily)